MELLNFHVFNSRIKNMELQRTWNPIRYTEEILGSTKHLSEHRADCCIDLPLMGKTSLIPRSLLAAEQSPEVPYENKNNRFFLPTTPKCDGAAFRIEDLYR